MNPRERGFLLLTSHLGDPDRKVLTVAQFRTLAMRVRSMDRKDNRRQLQQEDLVAIGYDRETAQRILWLLSQEDALEWYLHDAKRAGCVPITRLSQGYPMILRQRLGLDCPACLWAKGDVSLLEKPAVALVGSRTLGVLNQAFAEEAGRQAALQGMVLVSGNARGADRIAQDSCLAHGGQVISIVADQLENCAQQERILYLSEDGYDLAFSAARALSRNRVIHSLGCVTLVAQCSMGRGGTWKGTTQNLKHNWSRVCCLDDGSEASMELANRGAELIDGSQLLDLQRLQPDQLNFIDQ